MVQFCCENSESPVKAYLRKINHIESLLKEEELELGRKIVEGNVLAKKKLVQANLRLVINIVRKYSHNNLSFLDMIQEGNLGLMIAAEKYNYKFGYRFSTYAVWWIKQTINKSISEQSYGMKIPVYVQETVAKYSKLKSNMEKLYNCQVSDEKVAEKLNISESKVQDYIQAFTRPISIDSKFAFKDGNESTISEFLTDSNYKIDKKMEFDNLKQDINTLLEKLKDREKDVIKMRFGLDDIRTKTLEEIGNIYGVTKECIRKTELRALKKLQSVCKDEDLLACYL